MLCHSSCSFFFLFSPFFRLCVYGLQLSIILLPKRYFSSMHLRIKKIKILFKKKHWYFYQKKNIDLAALLQANPSTSQPGWYFTRKEIDENTPSRRDGVNLTTETKIRKCYCKLLQDLGNHLHLWVLYMFVICLSFLIERLGYYLVGFWFS